MHHVAIMKKEWGLLPKILAGEKTIESRWYKNRSAPWGKIAMGDSVYFKNSGEPVSVVAEVGKVLLFENMTPQKVKSLLARYGKKDGIEKSELPKYFKLFKNKNYCLLIFLKNPRKVARPFQISKKGYGSMTAWICVPNIASLKR